MAAHPVSPLAPARFPSLPAMPGVRFATGCTGMRYKGRDDLMLAELAPGSTVAAVTTRSRMCSPSVLWCRQHARSGRIRAIVGNAGNANTFTGRDGERAVARTAAAAAKLLGCKKEEVFIASTGVIGVKLPVEMIEATLPALAGDLAADRWETAARAIMTTDTFPKASRRVARIGGTEVAIAGFCKGSGMIAPDMATMHCYVLTNAKLPASVLRTLLKASADRSFNAMTVDGDTSTSDVVLLCATGQSKHARVASAGERALADFRAKLDEVMIELAQLVAKDGEGAQKFITINVAGAASRDAARRVGLAIGNSPLVKTAIAAADANWGRVVMAVGKCGEKADRDRLVIRFGGVTIAAKGEQVPGYDEAPVAKHLAGRDVVIDVDVGVGKGAATVWTCDLTHGYID
ncbi:MAG: bifunctional glutamate N-acetyltransferase/amino-acid acetyltransferase ArgJ, partial [Alphaproteobacteria bacterium]|nr:bifunctional glutamate N-acetyltransferase/amino-acid acetyltransferase ArgJ [Alphaproteobacteria bacterium]